MIDESKTSYIIISHPSRIIVCQLSDQNIVETKINGGKVFD